MKVSISNYLVQIIYSLLMISQVCTAQKTGINTITPAATLDVNGDLIIRNVPLVGHNGDNSFFEIGVDSENRVVTKNKDVTSYSAYLGFDPMAPSHFVKMPLKVETNYITKITGTSIGACNGVKVDFELQFIDNKFISATLQAYPLAASQSGKVYDKVILSSTANISSDSLEMLAKAGCSAQAGHILSLSADGYLQVSFNDRPTYYPNAGIFVIYSVEKSKYK